MNKKTFGTIACMVSAIYFGFMPFFTTMAYEDGATPMTVSTLRFVISIPVLWVIVKIRKADFKLNAVQLRDISLLATVGQGLTTVLIFTSYTLLNTGTATTIHFMYPACTILGCAIFLKERIPARKLICVILCTAGIILFYNGGGNISGLGVTLAFASSISYAFYSIYLEHSFAAKVDSFVMLFYLSIIGAVMLGLMAVFTGQLSFDFGLKGWIACTIIAVFNTCVGAYGFQIGVKYIGAQNTTMLSTLEPVTSIIVGMIAYNEGFTVKTLVGTICIIISTLIVAKSAAGEEEKEADKEE